MTLEIVPMEPFTLLPGQELKKSFSRIDSYSSVIQPYKLKVAESAPSATYELEFRIYRDGSGTYITKKIPISVQGSPKIVIKEVKTNPESIQPGDEVEISVFLSNEGTGSAYQTEFVLTPETDKTTGLSVINPVLSGGIFYMGDFPKGTGSVANFKLKIENDAEYKSYLSALSGTFNDELGIAHTISFGLGIPVKGRPLLDVLNEGLDAADYKVELTNLGTAAAKGIKVSLVQGGQIRGVNVVSEIKAGKYKAVRFSDYQYGHGTLNITFYDESNDPHATSMDIYIQKPISGSAESGVSPLVPAALGILVVAETYYIWRIRKRKK
jgi:hypothetical protein